MHADLFLNTVAAGNNTGEPLPPPSSTAAAAAGPGSNDSGTTAAAAAAAGLGSRQSGPAAEAGLRNGRQQRREPIPSVSTGRQQHCRPLSFAEHVNKTWGSHRRRMTLSDNATAVKTRDEKVLWRKLYFQYTHGNKTDWQKILREFNTVAEVHKDLQKQQSLLPSVFHKSMYWLQQYEKEEVRAAQENYPMFLSAVSTQWTGIAADIQPGLSQAETIQYAQMMQRQAATDAAAATNSEHAEAAPQNRLNSSTGGGLAPSAAAAAAAAAAASGADAYATGLQRWVHQVAQQQQQQQQQYVMPDLGHFAAGLSSFGGLDSAAGLSSSGIGFQSTLGMPWLAAAGGAVPGAAAAEAAAADIPGLQGQRQRLVSRRAAGYAEQQQQKRPRQYKKQRCQQCWNLRAADQDGGRRGKASHCKWGVGFCEMSCAVCMKPMQEHTAPCPRPAD